MPTQRHHQVIVIGAGIAGLTAARALQAHGHDVAVLEKSRGYGGRAASRSVHGERIDHGAQFVTARDPRFLTQVEAWLADGTMARWTHGLPSWTAADGWCEPTAAAHPRFVCPDGMNALGKALAQGVRVARETQVAGLQHRNGRWCAETLAGTWCAEQVIVSVPLPQALALLAEVALPPARRAQLAAVSYAPCHALAAGFTAVAEPAWRGVRLTDHPELAWIANDTSKRRDAGSGALTLMLHATPAFTRRRYDDIPDAIARDLLSAASTLLPWVTDPDWTYHHRWRYAQPERTLPEPALALSEGLTVCGDAFGAGRVEGAYLSGLAAAEQALTAA